MKNLIALFQRYKLFFIFLMLQIVSFSMIFSRGNKYHHAAFTNSSNFVVGGIYSTTSDISGYFHLKEENDLLVEENLKLKQLLKGYDIQVGDVFTRINDTLYQQSYWFTDAKVTNSSIKNRKNYLTINRGTTHNIEPGMAVVGTKGMVGFILSSSKHYSTVMPIINEYFEVFAMHENSKSFGRIVWDETNGDWRTASMIDVPDYVDIEIGDKIVSRGSDYIFPEGELVGYVRAKEKIPGKNLQTLKVELAEDFAAIYDVKVIKSVVKNEVDELEAELP